MKYIETAQSFVTKSFEAKREAISYKMSNPSFGSAGGQPEPGGGSIASTQPVMRPGYGMPIQQQPRPYAPPPAGFVPSQGPAPGQSAAPVMPPGGGYTRFVLVVHKDCLHDTRVENMDAQRAPGVCTWRERKTGMCARG